MISHNHHIIPRHACGTDDPSNLIRLTIPEHAEAHRLLWVQNGSLKDKFAWLMLSSRTEEAEMARRELIGSPEVRAKMSVAHMGHKCSPETRDKISKSHMGNKYALGHKRSPEHCANLSKALVGHPVSQETRNKISKAKIGRKQMSEAYASS